MADLSWAAALTDLDGGSGGTGGAVGKSIDKCSINEQGELEILFTDGTKQTVGRVVGQDGKVYVPHIDNEMVLSYTIEDVAGEVPDEVDLNADDEWREMQQEMINSEYSWEEMPPNGNSLKV